MEKNLEEKEHFCDMSNDIKWTQIKKRCFDKYRNNVLDLLQSVQRINNMSNKLNKKATFLNKQNTHILKYQSKYEVLCLLQRLEAVNVKKKIINKNVTT